ncbi:MAG: hypothetical protein JWN70_2374 [Planctomycetaceae bacterium]|nr:hypothetical protein [Planctomycetaceae bacterium]
MNMIASVDRLQLPQIAIGPIMPTWGSWEWLGEELIPELSQWYRVTPFGRGETPEGRIIIIIKHRPIHTEMSRLPKTAQLVFCPVDLYGSVAEIDADAAFLRRCSRIVVHCRRLRRYFSPYSLVEEMDHHVRFVPEHETPLSRDGYLLWVGSRSNLSPLVEWVNCHRLTRKLVVLTNLEDRSKAVTAASLGFVGTNEIEIDAWSQQRHLERLRGAAAALDIKGADFRQRHKPPAKAIDFIAAGIPLAMNQDASSVEHLAELGFTIASPEDLLYWFSDEYVDETRRFGNALREMLSRSRIACRLRRIIDTVLTERLPHDSESSNSRLLVRS